MKNQTFLTILSILVGIGLILTLSHLLYAIYAYQHCSIIYFIGEELWG